MVGPIMRIAGSLLTDGLLFVYNNMGFVGGGLFGLVYAPIVIIGMHHSFIAIETQLLADIPETSPSRQCPMLPRAQLR